MSLPSDDAFEMLSADSLRRLVIDLSQRLHSLEDQVSQLETAETSQVALQVENQELRDEIARLKNLPPRPPFKSSGMEKATEREVRKSGGPSRRRGAKRDRDRVTREEVLTTKAPTGSRFKGYETVLVRELAISSEVVRYRRERWLSPEGKTIIAPLPAALLGGFGANLRRFCLVLHAQGQVTTERLTLILNGIGMEISKRQVVRILTSRLDCFIEEDQAVLRAGLATAPFISVNDTGARHARRDGITTQIGGAGFTVFRTGRSKSRLNFLSLLRAGREDYVINDAALDYMRRRKVAPDVAAHLAAHPKTLLTSQMAWYEHLVALRRDVFDRTLLREVSEGAFWGAVRHHGLMENTVVVSDDAGQFRVPNHALCWVHAERLLQKLMPKTPQQVRKIEKIRDEIWTLYRDLKLWKLTPAEADCPMLAKRFDNIFTQLTGYKDLDQLLARLHRQKHELLKVLERPEIPLHTNASENDLRACVTKRRISGGTMSIDGRQARDVMLGLMKTCRKLGISFFVYLGDRLGLNQSAGHVPFLPDLVAGQPV
ncbi:transposase [Paracoccus gahaiensis]|uniref:Transposase n=1 Tax=Paracoccus gahaiensis TaxID=1706839 RepID=A0A4U0RSB0_9RHOB|nr:transposase [Paracoccus gahaiensis]TJZ91224.1 transposase [Paracoccus gahaiensis]